MMGVFSDPLLRQLINVHPEMTPSAMRLHMLPAIYVDPESFFKPNPRLVVELSPRSARLRLGGFKRKVMPDDQFLPELDIEPKFRSIIRVVAAFYEISVTEMMSARRAKKFVRARQVAAHLGMRLTTQSIMELANIMRRDHTTLIYARDKIAEEMKTNAQLVDEVEMLTTKIKNECARAAAGMQKVAA